MEILQCSRITKCANKRGNEANNKRHEKSAKKRGRCQNIAKYITEILSTEKNTS